MDFILETNYTKKQFIDLLNKGICPICSKNGFKQVLIHISRIHLVNRIDLKDELFIARDTSFCDESIIVTKRDNALKNGLGTIIQGGKQRKKYKLDKVTIDKMVAYRNLLESKERSLGIIKKYHTPESRKKASETWKANPVNKVKMKQKSISATIKQFGSEDGIPDIFYAKVAFDFINALLKSRKRGVFERMASEHKLKKHTIYRQVKVAVERGLLKYTGDKNYPNGELTEKAKILLQEEYHAENKSDSNT